MEGCTVYVALVVCNFGVFFSRNCISPYLIRTCHELPWGAQQAIRLISSIYTISAGQFLTLMIIMCWPTAEGDVSAADSFAPLLSPPRKRGYLERGLGVSAGKR
jgi:hypothetical protein